MQPDVIFSEVSSLEVIEETSEPRVRRGSNEEVHKLVKVAIVIFVKLKGKHHDKISTPDFEAEVLTIGFVKTLKIIPKEKGTELYFYVQRAVLVVTFGAFIAGMVRRYRTRVRTKTEETTAEKDGLNAETCSKKPESESMTQFILIVFVHFFLPVLDLVPSVYVWYDYNTSEELAYDRAASISSMLFAFTFLKVCFFVARTLIINYESDKLFNSKRRLTLAKKLLFGGVSGGVLQFLLVDSVKPLLVYFYFNRYVYPGENVSTAAFGCFILLLVKHLHSLIYFFVKIISKLCCLKCQNFITSYSNVKDVTQINNEVGMITQAITNSSGVTRSTQILETLAAIFSFLIQEGVCIELQYRT